MQKYCELYISKVSHPGHIHTFSRGSPFRSPVINRPSAYAYLQVKMDTGSDSNSMHMIPDGNYDMTLKGLQYQVALGTVPLF